MRIPTLKDVIKHDEYRTKNVNEFMSHIIEIMSNPSEMNRLMVIADGDLSVINYPIHCGREMESRLNLCIDHNMISQAADRLIGAGWRVSILPAEDNENVNHLSIPDGYYIVLHRPANTLSDDVYYKLFGHSRREVVELANPV